MFGCYVWMYPGCLHDQCLCGVLIATTAVLEESPDVSFLLFHCHTLYHVYSKFIHLYDALCLTYMLCIMYGSNKTFFCCHTEQADMHVASYRVPMLLTVPGTMDLEQNIAVTLGETADAISARDFVSAIYLSHDAVFDKDKDMTLVAQIDNDLGNFRLL